MTGFESPNYTMIPNDLFDVEMSKMGYAELKVVLAICRQTFGYHKMEKHISLTTLEEMTGLSRVSILQGALEAEKNGYIQKKNTGRVTLWMVKLLNQSNDRWVKLLNRNGKGSIPPSIKESIKETQNETYQEEFFELKIKEKKPVTPLEQTWNMVKGQLLIELPRQSRIGKVIDYAKPLKDDGGEMVVEIDNPSLIEEINDRLSSTANRLISGITNSKTKTIKFIVQEDQ